MTLSAHAVAGSAAALIFRQYPVLGLLAALASHYLLDGIPHWHYPMPSIKKSSPSLWWKNEVKWGPELAKDAAKAAADGLLGLALSIVLAMFTHPEFWFLAVLGAGFGVLPDFLQFLNYLTKSPVLAPFQRFHSWWHAEKRHDEKLALGLSIETLAMFLSAGLVSLIK